MDHRITIAIVGVFGAVLGFTFLVVSLTTTVGPDGAQAVFGSVTDDDATGEEPSGPSPREILAQVLKLLDRDTEQWRRDHAGREPDFAAYPDWQQFVHRTQADGTPSNGGTAGSYFSRAPINPLNGLGTVVVVDRPVRPAERVPTPPGRAGFVYSTVDRCYWGTNGSARVVLVRAPQPATPPAPTGPGTAPATPAATSENPEN